MKMVPLGHAANFVELRAYRVIYVLRRYEVPVSNLAY
jgi:hypothetical protein